MLDILIKDGLVIDGSNCPGEIKNVGIRDDKIVFIGNEYLPAHSIIDAKGLVVSPGFIDMHSHSGLMVFDNPKLIPKLQQGITTEVIGVDGISVAPVSEQGIADRKLYVEALDGSISTKWTWRSYPEYLDTLDDFELGTNFVSLVPHGSIRDVVMGNVKRSATADEIYWMQSLVDEALSAGAAGLSFGLVYIPGAYADNYEIQSLVSIASLHNKFFAVHVRNEAEQILEAVDEIMRIGQDTNTKTHISHLKIIGQDNQSLLPELLMIFDKYLKRGVLCSFDQYPYIAGNTQLAVLIPPEYHEGGSHALLSRLQIHANRQKIRNDMQKGINGWENLYKCCGWHNIWISSLNTAKNKLFLGMSIQEIAKVTGKTPFSVVFDLLIDESMQVGMIDFYGDEKTLELIMKNPLHTVCSDGIFAGKASHPRLYGAFPRVLGKYVRERKVLSLEQAIHNMTAKPAQILRLNKRGLVQEGYFADLVIFDAARIHDKATFSTPQVPPIGITAVLVNGQIALDKHGRVVHTAGRLLRV